MLDEKQIEEFIVAITNELFSIPGIVFGDGFVMCNNPKQSTVTKRPANTATTDPEAYAKKANVDKNYNAPNGVEFCYIGNRSRHDHKGIVVIANQIIGNQVFFGVSYCSPKDRFDKNYGRNLAFHRMNSPFYPTKILIPRVLSRKNIKISILARMVSDDAMPSWAMPLVYSELIDMLIYR
jgi:hypothetical protein